MGIREVEGLEVESDRQADDDIRRQFARVHSPLLLGISPDKRLIKRAADQGDRLLFEVGRHGEARRGRLAFDQLFRRARAHAAAEKGTDRAKVDRHRIDLASVDRQDTVPVIGKRREAVEILPDLLDLRMKDMCAVFVAFDARLGIRLGIAVAAQVLTPLQHADVLVELVGNAFGNREAKRTCADHDCLVVFQGTPNAEVALIIHAWRIGPEVCLTLAIAQTLSAQKVGIGSLGRIARTRGFAGDSGKTGGTIQKLPDCIAFVEYPGQFRTAAHHFAGEDVFNAIPSSGCSTLSTFRFRDG